MRSKSTPPKHHRDNCAIETNECGSPGWAARESAGGKFADLRLGRRFSKLLEQMSEHFGASVPMACQDWANTKAAYRFFSNERVSEKEILEGHFSSTRARAAVVKGPLLILHDTTEFP